MKSPYRVAAGRANQKLRGPFTADGLQRLREAAMGNKAWLLSTGPKTAAGKAKVALNGRKHMKDEMSAREKRAAVADVDLLVGQLRRLRLTVNETIQSV